MEFYNKNQMNYIGGEFTPAISEGWIENICPSDEFVLGLAADSGEKDVAAAVAAARKAYPLWKSLSSLERGDLLLKLALELDAHREELARIIAIESGKSIGHADGEVGAAIAQGKFMASEGAKLSGRLIPSASPQKTVMIKKEPVGVAGLIVAFNTPIANITWKVFPALICGNTAVLKASEDTPATAGFFTYLANKVGFPPGVLNVVQGKGQIAGKALCEHEGIDVLSFTGSTAVGKQIAKNLGPRLTKLFLELGGKNPLVICEDADLELALDWSLKSSFSNAGQRCASSSRILVQNSIYEKFKSEFVARTSKLKVGVGDKDDLGPVINKKQQHRILEILSEAPHRGIDILAGGKSPEQYDKGCYIEPTILEGASLDDLVSQEELFAPVTNLYAFDTIEEAITMANNSQYGLTAAIHTRNIDNAMHFAEYCESGVVNINGGTHGSEPHFPFGGVKNSGNGFREPGIESFEIYSDTKVVSINTTN